MAVKNRKHGQNEQAVFNSSGPLPNGKPSVGEVDQNYAGKNHNRMEDDGIGNLVPGCKHASANDLTDCNQPGQRHTNNKSLAVQEGPELRDRLVIQPRYPVGKKK